MLRRRRRLARAVMAWVVVTGAVIAGTVIAGASPALHAGDLTVTADFPNGNGTIQFIDQQSATIRLSPTEHVDRGWACWWYVRVDGIEPGETLTLEVDRAPWATPTRAAISVDNQHWEHSAPGTRHNGRITYRIPMSAATAWLAWGPPFTLSDAEIVVQEAARLENAEAITLCETREGHSVPAIRIGSANPNAYGIWIQARQHAWEAGSSWVAAGLIHWLTSADPAAQRLRNAAAVTVIPIMDVDNVVRGAGGKNQVPQDHNRDWSERPHWPSVAAAMGQIKQLSNEQRFDLFIDLHNPGPNDGSPFFYVTPRNLLNAQHGRNLDRFLAAAREEIVGPLAFLGETRESGASYDRNWRRISKNWVAFHTADHVVAVTLETSWNTDHSTTSSYLTVGRQLGQAIERYLRTDPRQ